MPHICCGLLQLPDYHTFCSALATPDVHCQREAELPVCLITMAFSTVGVGATVPLDFFVAWKDDVASVRNLYHERKYRRCAVLCSELLPNAVWTS